MTYSTYDFALTLPITQEARRTASEFARQQPTPAKAEQVRLNTLAILVTQSYLELMEIPTDRSVTDSWNPLMRVCLDVADLELPGVGRLECRPMLPDADRCFVPAETWEERVGYVVVRVDESAQEAQLLGFVPSIMDEELELAELRSLEELLDHLYALRTAPESVRVAIGQTLTNLGNWLQAALQEGQQVFDAGWQAVEQVLAPTELSPAYAFRRRGASVRRAKRLDLAGTPIALVVDVQEGMESQMEIRLQLHPVQLETGLPNGLQLAVLDQDGAVVIDAIATGSEDFLELQIDGTSGEAFSVQIRWQSWQTVQSFVI